MRSENPIRAAKISYIVTSVAFCVLGVLLIVLRNWSVSFIGVVTGIMLIAFGIVKLLGYFSKDLYRLAFQFDLAFGILLMTLGAIILAKPERAMSFVCLMLGVAIAIKLDDGGPVFFSQTRIGLHGRPFKMYKFRSMVTNAEELKKKLAEENGQSDRFIFKMKDDPRITRVGKFIRKTSIDELPQFYNVLKGDMSLVGTRPPTVDEFRQYESHQKRRLSAKPGITGLWQVSGRNEIKDFEDVVKLDVQYIDNWSIGLDIKIILKTIKVVFEKGGE